MKEQELEFDFEGYLFKKYPDIFPVDDNGNLLPQHLRCWNDCPKGWESIVENLFGCIDNYIKNTTSSKFNPKRKIVFACRRKSNYIIQYLKRLISPTNSLFSLGSYPLWKTKTVKVLNYINANLFNPSDLYITEHPPAVKIQQYKEKYGTLRIYHDGGDEEVDGMIRYAEFLSSHTCMYTGKPGELCKRGGWYATLSKAEAKKNGFKAVSDI